MDIVDMNLFERASTIANQYFNVFATERQRLQKVKVTERNAPTRKMDFPLLHYDIKGLLMKNGRLNTNAIKSAVRKIAASENKILAKCKDGEDFFEYIPLTVWIWQKNEGLFTKIYESINSLNTPTKYDLDKLN